MESCMIRKALIVIGCALTAPAQAASPAFGRWLTDDGSAVVLVGPCGAQLCGTIERVLDPRAPATDINNPDPALRSRPLTGTMVLRHYTGSGAAWTGGRAYDPKTGSSYRSQLTALANGKLKVTGCIAFLCRSRYWTRAN
jgi:uncharacterized protein (DUF2147 family)